MKRISLALFICGLTLSVSAQLALTPDTTTTLEAKSYAIDTSGSYTLTTNGDPVAARLTINHSATIILKDCYIQRTSQYSPITIAKPGITLEIQIAGTNAILTDYNANDTTATPVISAAASCAPTLLFAAHPNATDESELLLRASSSTYDTTPPIQFNGTGTVTFRSGTVRIATSEEKDANSIYWIPALVSAETVTLRGGTVIAQMCPRDNLGIKGNKLIEKQSTSSTRLKYVNVLFDCATFNMFGGMLTTQGTSCTSSSTNLAPTATPYDTFYAYSPPAMATPTAATTQRITGGINRDKLTFSCYGFQANASIPSACFTHTGTKTFPEQTADASGTVTQLNISDYPNLELKYADSTSEAYATVFNATLTPTETGCSVKATLGINHISLDPQTLQPILHITLDLPGENSSILQKIINVQAYCTMDDQTPILVAEEELAFTRASSNAPFTAILPCRDSGITGTTARYTIKACN